ncbi:MAG: TspO/MBR family protein [Geminicoccaceae bacterium]
MTGAEAPGWLVGGGAALLVTVIAVAGMALTKIEEWYYSLRKPSWQPPDWLFGPAWTSIFALMATAIYLAWYALPNDTGRWIFVALCLANGVLNVAWNLCFFTWRRPDWAGFEVVALWLSILALIVFVAPSSGLAAWLLVPYLLWVSFAAVLNWTITRLNAPFGETSKSAA